MTETWTVESVDPGAPSVVFSFVSGDVLTAECGRYTARIEREEEQRSRVRLNKDGTPFVDISVHHRLLQHDGDEFTDEVTHRERA